MNKAQLVASVADRLDLTKKQSENTLDTIIELIIEQVSMGEKVTLIGFGTFQSSKRAARKGRNPQTNEEIMIPACKVPKFKPGSVFKSMVANHK